MNKYKAVKLSSNKLTMNFYVIELFGIAFSPYKLNANSKN